MSNADIVNAIAEMMDNWNKLERGMRHLFPDATPEQLNEKTRAAMDLAIQQIKERHMQ